MTNIKANKIILLTLMFIIAFSMFHSACGKKSEEKAKTELQSLTQEKTKEKLPENLLKIEAQIDNIIKSLGGPSVTTDEAGGQQQTTQQGGQQQTTQQGSQQQTTQGGQQQTTQQGGQNVDWTNISKLIDELHYQWNEYTPEIAESSSNLINRFSTGLNSLTTTASERSMSKALYSANELYSNIPDFYSLYNSEVSPEVKRITYYVRKIVIESGKDWDQASRDNENLENSWSLLKKTLKKEQNDAEKKLDFSIYELKTVISQKSKQLTDIKGKIVLSNIQELEESYKKQ